ncbi:MAG: hypothetical protein ACXVRK_14880 [Gaiellaceae bacterium]
MSHDAAATSPRKPGRRTAAEEFAAQLERLDLPKDVIETIRAADPRALPAPPVERLSAEQMRDNALAEVYAEFSQLKGIAKLQALKQFVEATRGQPKPEPVEPDPMVWEVIAGVADKMPAQRRREILEHERVRLFDEIAGIDAYLAKLETEAA